jgi:hypothetical protein
VPTNLLSAPREVQRVFFYKNLNPHTFVIENKPNKLLSAPRKAPWVFSYNYFSTFSSSSLFFVALALPHVCSTLQKKNPPSFSWCQEKFVGFFLFMHNLHLPLFFMF